LINYKAIFAVAGYMGYFMHSFIISVAALLLSLLIGVPASYALSRFEFPGRDSLAFTFLSFKFAPELFVIIPLYVIYQKTGLYDTYIGLIWVYQLIGIPFITWILRSYFQDVSPELEYAAQMDGYSRMQAFFKVLLPIVRPGLMAACLIVFIFTWNEFTLPLLLGGSGTQTITVEAIQLLGTTTAHYGRLAAAAVVSMVPEVALTLLVQKHLVRGLSFGAVKG
jgi:multiple sugar transport system permease protein